MKLYNTLTRQIEDILALEPPKVTVYTCGPTVYDYAHIGHWFNYIRMDMLIRALNATGLEPNWVMNITDVGHLVSDADDGEDKLEKGARREGKTAWEVAEFYTKDFLECMEHLNMLQPNELVKATEHIDDQIHLIQRLEASGYSYVIDDGVYFDTSKFEGYERFAQLDLDEQQAGARVVHNEQKRNNSDFALWKLSPADSTRDMEWDSPWGKGFPGWHIECSAMSMKYLGDTLDIHTGGIDHVPVHHTNEIAQSEAATGKRFANYWMHSNHVMVDGEKISKSLGNGIRLQELIEQGFSPDVIRLYILESHYRTQSHFNIDGIRAARTRYNDLRAMAVLRWQTREKTYDASSFAMSDVGTQLTQCLVADLNTPQMLALLSNVSTQIQAVQLEKDMVEEFMTMLSEIDSLTGLRLTDVPDITSDQKQLLEAREQAREAKDWARADELREQLTQQGVGLRDTDHGAIWFWL